MNDKAYQRWICDACGYIYDEAKGDPDSGLSPGTRYEDIPDNWLCPLCGLSKGDLRLMPEITIAPSESKLKRATPSKKKSRGGSDYIVIVGAGIAGWSVAEAIRQKDPDTPLLLVAACEGITYPKPALSTSLAHGKSAEDLQEQDAATRAATLNMDVRTETRVIKIDPEKKRLTTAKGGIEYGRLVLALGAQQRKVDIAGDAKESLLRVNDLISYRKLRARLAKGARHVTILGAGLIGCEFSEDLSSAGYEVSVVDPADYPLVSLLPEDTGMQLKSQLADKGVDWHFHTTLDSLDQSGNRLRATLSSGEAIETDIVLSAAGLVANTELAEKTGLKIDKGIVTDRLMRTSNPDIYAIGDCASVEGQVFAYIEPIRRQAETIASHLTGIEKPFKLQPPLVRVKTPSFPLTICPPSLESNDMNLKHPEDDRDRLDYVLNDQLVGFVLSRDQAAEGTVLYRKIIS